MALPELLQSELDHIRWPNTYISDILDPNRAPQHVYHNDQVPSAIVNCKDNHIGLCLHWIALPVNMPSRTTNLCLYGILQHKR